MKMLGFFSLVSMMMITSFEDKPVFGQPNCDNLCRRRYQLVRFDGEDVDQCEVYYLSVCHRCYPLGKCVILEDIPFPQMCDSYIDDPVNKVALPEKCGPLCTPPPSGNTAWREGVVEGFPNKEALSSRCILNK